MEILLSVGSFSAISAITSSFYVCFSPMNCQTEGIHVLLQMIGKRSTNYQRSSAMALVKLAKTLQSLKCGLRLTDFSMFEYFQPVLALIEPPRFTCREPGKILKVKMRL